MRKFVFGGVGDCFVDLFIFGFRCFCFFDIEGINLGAMQCKLDFVISLHCHPNPKSASKFSPRREIEGIKPELILYY